MLLQEEGAKCPQYTRSRLVFMRRQNFVTQNIASFAIGLAKDDSSESDNNFLLPE